MGRSKGQSTGKPSALLDTRVTRGMGASPMIRRDSGHSRSRKTRPGRPQNFTTCLRLEQQLYHNAHNLLIDACILYQHGSYPTSFALAVLAYEELGKMHLLDHINSESYRLPAQRRDQLDRLFSGKQGFNHVIKQRWALFNTKKEAFSELYDNGHLDRLKQACFYVGFRNGRIMPPDRIKDRTAFNQIKRVLKLARNSEDIAFLDFGEDGKWESTADDRRLVKSYMRKAEQAVGSLRDPRRSRVK